MAGLALVVVLLTVRLVSTPDAGSRESPRRTDRPPGQNAARSRPEPALDGLGEAPPVSDAEPLASDEPVGTDEPVEMAGAPRDPASLPALPPEPAPQPTPRPAAPATRPVPPPLPPAPPPPAAPASGALWDAYYLARANAESPGTKDPAVMRAEFCAAAGRTLRDGQGRNVGMIRSDRQRFGC